MERGAAGSRKSRSRTALPPRCHAALWPAPEPATARWRISRRMASRRTCPKFHSLRCRPADRGFVADSVVRFAAADSASPALAVRAARPASSAFATGRPSARCCEPSDATLPCDTTNRCTAADGLCARSTVQTWYCAGSSRSRRPSSLPMSLT